MNCHVLQRNKMRLGTLCGSLYVRGLFSFHLEEKEEDGCY